MIHDIDFADQVVREFEVFEDGDKLAVVDRVEHATDDVAHDNLSYLVFFVLHVAFCPCSCPGGVNRHGVYHAALHQRSELYIGDVPEQSC